MRRESVGALYLPDKASLVVVLVAVLALVLAPASVLLMASVPAVVSVEASVCSHANKTCIMM